MLLSQLLHLVEDLSMDQGDYQPPRIFDDERGHAAAAENERLREQLQQLREQHVIETEQLRVESEKHRAESEQSKAEAERHRAESEQSKAEVAELRRQLGDSKE